MTDEFLVDWAFSSQDSIKKEVEKRFPDEIHRWPISHGFKSEGYTWDQNFVVIILRNEITNIPSIGKVDTLDENSIGTPTLDNIEQWQKFLRNNYSIRNQDFVMIIPLTPGKNISERWDNMSEEGKNIWRKQLEINIQIQYYHLKGFDMNAGFLIPPGYAHLTGYCQMLFKEHPDFSKNVFLMMKFDNNNLHLKKTEEEIRSVLIENGFNPLRADDKVFPTDRDLWDNVCVYMLCCKQGIAVLEKESKLEFNPNVAIEYGFMRALNKRALLLADKKFPKDRADIVGKLRSTFTIEKPESSIRTPIEKWIKEIS
ncbi:hypothetical protein K0U27_02045 [archaeon]|nr:hypothetical protein [archaeon]